ncbi:putative Rho-GAP domain-containing protein [Seiridium cardinale]|uniref:Rho-GAP domain-containing protein n=1 Tax=Seiridium cardinale TaxID=138064 RepID=A0ABR2XZ23_9PEZI
MTSAATPSKPTPTSPPQQHAQPSPSAPQSPPSKRDLKSWWKRFQVQSKHQESQARADIGRKPGVETPPSWPHTGREQSQDSAGLFVQEPMSKCHYAFYNAPSPAPVRSQMANRDQTEIRPHGIFGVPLRQSITYANVAISLVDDDGKSYIYGYVPIVVAKCGVFLKEKATGVEGIFRLSGSEKRIKELKLAFDSPDRYGKGLVWDGYTVHDAANVLRRYLNDLPEPVVPLDLYEKFREPLRGHTKQAVGDIEGTQLVDNFNEAEAIDKYQALIKILPPLNRQLLLYILDLLAVFAAKADENRMTAQNLAAIFQPGMLSHPHHAMAPEEYRLNQCVIIFLIENQDHFLIGMQGTAADEKTKQDIEKGTPVIVTPTTPSKRSSGPVRTASNASAGAESVSRDGKIRRNRSTSSRHSRHSNGASTPGSPALATTPITGGGSSGLARSNTVPSKKSPHVPSGRFQRQDSSPSVAVAPASPSPAGSSAVPQPTVSEEPAKTPERSSDQSSATHLTAPASSLAPGLYTDQKSQERLLEHAPAEATTPAKERIIQNLFNLSPSEAEKRQPNKLRKKRIPGSTNPSAQSSTASLTHSGAVSPSLESSNPFDKSTRLEPTVPEHPVNETPSEVTPTASTVPSASTLQASQPETTRALKPKPSPPTSLHSSFNEGSDLDQIDENIPAPTVEQQEKERKRRWRLSRRKEDLTGTNTSQSSNLGINSYAEASTSTIGSGGKPRKSWTGESSDVAATLAEIEQSRERDESRGPLGWIKTKYREAKETADQKRTKSPPEEQGHHGFLPRRGKSVDIKRAHDERQGHPQDSNNEPQDVPLPMSPPPVPTTHEERAKAA